MSKLKKLREAKKLTQSALAAKLKVDVSTVSRWERGANLPRPFSNQETKLLKILGCTAKDLEHEDDD
jgi:transcriptional regulator with XRE-family HTH domain